MNITKKLFIAMTMVLGMSFTNAYATNESGNDNKVEALNGGSITYVGTIGPYNVEFDYTYIHMGPDDRPYFSYRYTKNNVNNGKSIDLRYAGTRGGYTIWKEYIKGRNTGTFTIKRTNTSINGTFVNSKGQKYNVRARMTESNWVD